MAGLNSEYKNKHKPLREGKSHYHQGYFTPQHPEKCVTPVNIYRSFLEFRFYTFFDNCVQIVRWGSEPLAVKYKNPISNMKYCLERGIPLSDKRYWKEANYNIDAWIELRTKEGDIRKIFIEIKPESQTRPPVLAENPKPKDYKKFNYEAQTYAVNIEKWKAAKAYCEERCTEFIVVTEKTLEQLSRTYR